MEKANQGEIYEPVPKEWEEVPEPVVITELKKFVVCLDTMGQDREFTADQKVFALKSVLRFKKHWENFELKKLMEDRDALLKEKDLDIEKFNEDFLADVKAREDILIEKLINPEAEEEEGAAGEEKKKEKKDEKKPKKDLQKETNMS